MHRNSLAIPVLNLIIKLSQSDCASASRYGTLHIFAIGQY